MLSAAYQPSHPRNHQRQFANAICSTRGQPDPPGPFFPVFRDDSITAQRELPELMAYR